MGKNSSTTFLGLATLALLMAGCISVSYKGESFTPTENVQIFKQMKDMPAGYRAVGKAYAHASSEDFTVKEIIDKIAARARAEGADAVFIESVSETRDGEVRPDEYLGTGPSPDIGWGDDDNFDGDVQKVDYDFDETRKDSSGEIPLFKTVVKALFLKKQ